MVVSMLPVQVLAEEFVEQPQVQETTAPAETVPTEAPVEPAPTAVPTEPASTEAPAEPEPTAAPAEPVPTEVATEPESTAAPTEPVPTETVGEPEADPVAVTAVSVTAEDDCTELTVGQTLQLYACVEPKTAAEQTILWESEEETVATVDETGLVTAVAAGEVTVTATAGGVTGSICLAVAEVKTELSEESGEITDIPAGAATVVDSGSCGANVTYTFDGTELIVSGTGPMDAGAGPWTAYGDKVCIVTVEQGVTTIGKQAFMALPNLVILELPNSITSIGESAFVGSTNLVSAKIPASVKSIGANAFASSGIRELKLQEGLTEIGANAFVSCSKLTAVTIPESVTTISAASAAKSPFYGCDSNMVITCNNFKAPDGWGEYWNYYASGKTLATTFREATAAEEFWDSVDPSMETIVIPAGITEIPAGAFENYTALKKVTIPSTVTSIGAKAFAGCTALELVHIPASVTTIAGELLNGPFYGCSESLVIYCDAETKPSGWGEFWNAVYGEIPCEVCFGDIEITEHYWRTLDITGVTDVVIPEGVIYIPGDFFTDSSIESVVIPDSVLEIEAYAFCNCSSLTSVDFGNGVQTIGASAFSGTAITELKLPKSLTTLGQYAFSNCASLKEAVIPEGVTVLPTMVFGTCSALERVVLPDTLTTIEAEAFNISGLKAIFLPASVTTISASSYSKSPFLGSSGLTVFCEADSAASGWSSYWNNVDYSNKATVCYDATQADADFWGSVDKNAAAVIIPNGVTVIPEDAFANKSTLQYVSISDTVKTIGKNAFYYCKGLVSAYIPSSVKTINAASYGDSPFYSCSSSVKIYCEAAEAESGWGECWNVYSSNGTTHSRLSTTYNYNRIAYDFWLSVDKTQETIVIPEGVTEIPENAFKGNTALKEITIPSTVKTIGASAFMNCTSLIKVKLSEGLESIGGSAFSGCTALESLAIPEGVTTIAYNLLSGCTALKSVTIPSTAETLVGGAFKNCTALETVHISDIEMWCNLKTSGATDMLYANPLANGAQLVVNGVPLTELVIPETVTSLRTYAFYGCEGLKKVTIPATVTSVGSYAFYGCKDLEEVYLHVAGTDVGSFIFKNCTALRTAVLGEGVTDIPSQAFEGCTALASVTLPETLTTIDSNAFKNCSALRSIQIPASVTTISCSNKSYSPFYGCEDLEIFTPLVSAPSGWSSYWNYISDSARATVYYNVIGDESAFWGSIDKTAETIEIPVGITAIPAGIFKNNTNLKTVIIPSSVTTIEANAFEGCTGLTAVTVPDSVTSIGTRAFYGCTGLTEVKLPAGLTAIPDYCFYGCTGLTEMDLPDSVTTIGNYAYRGCTGLKTVYLHEGLTTIGKSAFYGCTGLETVNIPASVQSISCSSSSDAPFYNCDSKLTIYCTAAEQPTGWSNYWDDYKSYSSLKVVYGVPQADVEFWLQLDKTQDTILIPDSVSAIPTDAFANNSTVKKIVLGTGVKSIGSYAFDYCTNLAFVYIPETVETIAENAFYNCSSAALYSSVAQKADGWASNWNYYGSSRIMPTYLGVSLQEAEYWAGLDKTQSVISLPSYIKSLPDSVFSGCTNITTVDLPEGLKSIGSKAFYNCSGLQELFIPVSVTSVASDAFRNAGLQRITFAGTMEQWMMVHPANTVTVQCADDAIYKSGSCGENVNYIITDDGILLISGSGPMANFGNNGADWYSDRSMITEVRIGEGVASIGNSAFIGCSSLTAVHLPQSLTAIGNSAFYQCSSLTGITLHEGLTTIGPNAFYGCRGMTGVDIPSTVTELGSSAFYNCSGLQTVTFLGNGIEVLPNNLFANCTKLQNFTIPNGVKEIGDYTFNYCGLLTEITVPEGVTRIGASAFQNCQELVSIYLPASLEYVGSYCFSGSTPDLYFAGSMEQWAKASATIYKAVCSDGTIRSWGSYGDNHFFTLTTDGWLNLTGTGPVPDYTDKGTVPWSGLTGSFITVTLPGDLPNIGRRMFESCYNLETITIPATVTSIGEENFTNSTKANIYYDGTMDQWLAMSPNNTTTKTINCTDGTILSNGDCGEGVRYMLTGDGNMTITGSGAMTNCTNYSGSVWYNHRSEICSVTIDSGVTSIGDFNFYDCSNLTKITMADSVTAIGRRAFYNCDALSYTTIGASVETIGEYAFSSCDSLSEITIPASVKSIGSDAFTNCGALRRVNTDDLGAWCGIAFGNSSANPMYYAKELLVDWTVAEYAEIPEGTPAISAYAFYNCTSLRELTIPASVTAVGENAFYGCQNLETIYFRGTTDRWLALCPDNERKVVCTDDAILRSSKCGETAHSVVYESGLLKINGTGAITSNQWGNYSNIITSVVIAPGITEIGDYKFGNLLNLTTVSIPEGVVSIGREAFANCPSLETVTIPASVQSIGDYAFRGCNGLQVINFEHVAADTLSIGKQAFYYSGNLSGSSGASRWVETPVGVPYARVIQASIQGYNWQSDQRRAVYHSNRTLPAESIEIEIPYGDSVLEAGLDLGLDVIFTPAESTSEILWSILEDESTGTATINEYGTFFALTPGIVTVQAQTHDSGVTDEIAITIEAPTADAEFVEVYVADYHLNEAAVGTTVQMIADVQPGNTKDKTVRWWIENDTGTATIDADGRLTALTTGTVTVYAETVNGIKGSCVVNILRYVEDFDFTFSGMEAPWTLAVGERIQIAAIPTPADASMPDPDWEIADESTASVEFRTYDGELQVIGKSAGTIVVIARSQDSRAYETSFELTVSEDATGTYVLSGGSKLLFNSQTGMITGVEGAVGDVTIPERIGNTVITGIAPYAFVTRSGGSAYGNQNLTSLVIPASVKSIGDYAFYNCDNLASVHFEGDSGLETIGSRAFNDCDGLATITYTGTALKSIGDYAFYDCDVLSGMTFPAGIERIGRSAFEYCESFRSLTIPEGLTDIGKWAFSGLDGLEELTMSGNLDASGWLNWETVDKLTLTGTTVIGGKEVDGGWSGVPGRRAKTVILMDTITRIEDHAFESCNEMTDITMSSNLEYIGERAFADCRGLTAVELPDGLLTLGEYAFAWCEELTELNIPESLTSIGRFCFEGSRKLQLFDLSAVPDTLKERLNLSDVVSLPEWLVRCESENMTVHHYLETVDGQPECYQIAEWYEDNEGRWIIPRGAGIVELHYVDEYTGARASKQISVEVGLEIWADSGNKVASGGSVQLYLCRPNGEIVAADWWLNEMNNSYAAIDSDGLLTAKSVSSVREIVVNALPREGGQIISKTFYIMPKATKVMLFNDDGLIGESGKAAQTINVDMSSLPQMLLRASCEPEDAFDGVNWSSSAPSVVEVDEGGMLTFLKPGTATIKATAAGTSVSASVKINVLFLETTKTLTAKAEVPAIGLQPGQSVQMNIFGADKTKPLDPALFDYTVSGVQGVVLDEEDPGLLTAGEGSGTATVTATLRGDPLNRKVTLKVKIIPLQAQLLQMEIAPHPLGELVQLTESGDKWLMILDAEEMAAGAGFQVDAVGYDYRDQLMFPDVKWAVSDSKMVKLSTNEAGDTFVNVLPDVVGSCVVQAKANDLGGAVAELTVEVRDYAPKLGDDTLTLNSYNAGYATTQLVEVYDNTVTEACLWEYIEDQDMWKTPDGLKVEVANGQLKIKAEKILSAGKYDLLLGVTCANGRDYSYDITVKVENKLPSVTVKQKSKFNLFYTGSAAEFTVTAKDAAVADVRLADESVFVMTMEDGVPVLRYSEAFLESPSATVNKKVAVEVFLEGYGVSVSKNITVSTATTQPKLTMTPASSVINTSSQFGQDPTTLVQIYDKTNDLWLDMEQDLVEVKAGTFAEGVGTSDGLLLTLTGTSGGTASITVQTENWTQPMTVKHKISVQTKTPALKLASSSLKLNRILAENTASTKVTLTQSNLELYDVQIISVAAEGTAIYEEAQKLDVRYEDGYIYAEIIDPEDAPKAATYSFYCIGTLANGQELAKVTLKVGVGSTAPKVKLKTTTLNLNTQLTGVEVASTAVTLTGAEGYELTGFELPENWDNEDIWLYVEDGVLKAELTNADAALKKHSLKVKPVLTHVETEREFTLSSAVTLYLNVYDSTKFSVTLSSKGKLDTLNPESEILYTITKMTNISGMLEGVSVVGTDGALFDAEVVEDSEKPQVRLTLLPGQDYVTNKTYKIKLELTICGQDVTTKELSFRVTQSKLKVTAPKTVTIFRNQSVPMEVALQVAEPARIWYVDLGSKTTAALKESVDELMLTEDNRVLLTLTDSSKLVKGKSYTLYLEVIPVNNAENVAPTQVKVTVKVKN